MKYTKLFFIFCLALVMSATAAHAIPSLQLDIAGGWYDTQTETVVASDNKFTLYAYLIPNQNNLLTDIYYVSAALVPVSQAGDYGSFKFNSQTVNVTSDMTWGTPPLSDPAGAEWETGDLQKHGIYDTYFAEFDFMFSDKWYAQTAAYNVQDNTGQGPTAGTGMYYVAFNIDTTNLAEGYAIHFDLYNENRTELDWDVNSNAPFSHDAESSRKVPEPSSLWLIGMGLAGLGMYARKRS